MAHVTVMVCDHCAALGTVRQGDEVQTFVVQLDTLKARTDLCDKHAEPLMQILIGHGVDGAAGRRPIDDARFEDRFATMEQVAEFKADYLSKNPPSAEAGLLPAR